MPSAAPPPAPAASRTSWNRAASVALAIAALAWLWFAFARWLSLEQPYYQRIARFLPHWGLWLATQALAYVVGDAILARAADGRIAWRWLPRWVAALLAGHACWCFAAASMLLIGTWSTTRHFAVVGLLAAIGVILAGKPRLPDLHPLAFARSIGKSRRPLLNGLLAGALGLTFASYAAEAQLPPWQHDAIAYHLTLPRLYVEEGGRFVPHFFYVSHTPHYPQLLMMPFVALENAREESGVFVDHLERLDHVGAQMNTALMAFLVVATLARMGRRLSGGWTVGLLAGALFAFDRAVEYQAASGYVEVHGAAWLTAGLALLLERRSAARRADKEWREPAGVWALFYGCVGMLFGVKFSYAPYLAAAWVAAVAMGPRVSLAQLKRPAILATPLAFFLLVAPWIGKSWLLDGTPFFPFFLDGSKLDPLLVDNSREVTAWLFTLARERDDPLAFARTPLELGLNSGWPYGMFNLSEASPGPLWILPLLGLLLLRRWRGARGWLLLTLGWVYLNWFLAVRQGRFLIPAYPILFLLAASGALLLLRLVPRRWIGGGAVALFAMFQWYFVAERGPKLAVACHAAFTLRQDGPLSATAEGKASSLALFRRLNRDKRYAGARVAMLMDNRTYYLDFPIAFADSSLEFPFWAQIVRDFPDPVEASRRFRERGADLLFVNMASLDHFERYLPTPQFTKSAAWLRAYLASPAFQPLERQGDFLVGRPVVAGVGTR